MMNLKPVRIRSHEVKVEKSLVRQFFHIQVLFRRAYEGRFWLSRDFDLDYTAWMEMSVAWRGDAKVENAEAQKKDEKWPKSSLAL